MTSKLQTRGNELAASLVVSFDFPVRFTRDAFAPSNPDLLSVLRRREPFRRHKVLFVLDAGLAKAQPWLADAAAGYVRAHKGSLTLAAPPVLLEGGETCKTRAGVAQWLRARLAAAGLDRQAHVVVAGGGAVLDAAGYAAATYLRGLRVTRLPSTLLAQADAGVAVKASLNGFARKNTIGVFAPPFGVVCDSRLLDSLPPRDRAAGMAEAFKAALVRDADFFHWICDHASRLGNWDRRDVDTLVRWSARLHLEHTAVGGDAFEQGETRPLDFGHWTAHRLEALSSHRLKHGEAVALGVAVDLLISREVCGLDAAAVEAAHCALAAMRLPLWDAALDERDEAGRPAIWSGLEESRERLGGDRSVTLLHDIAQPLELEGLEEPAVSRAVETLKRRARRR